VPMSFRFLNLSVSSWFVAYGNWLFKYRNSVFPVVMLAMFLVFRPVLAGGNPGNDGVLDQLGLFVAACGQMLRAAVIGYAYIKRGGVNKRVHAEELVTQGFFAHVRNPLYVGNLLILVGLLLIHNNPWVYVIGSLFFVTAYLAIVAAEETFLMRKFGAEYAEYCAQVNRWLPDLRGLPQTLGEMEFNWRRVVLKDYASCYAWVITALLLMYYEVLVHVGVRYSAQRAVIVLTWGAVATAAFLLVRFLKKRRILREYPDG